MKEIYNYLFKNCPTKDNFPTAVMNLQKEFAKLNIPVNENGSPTAEYILALDFLTNHYREIKSILSNKDCTTIIYK